MFVATTRREQPLRRFLDLFTEVLLLGNPQDAGLAQAKRPLGQVRARLEGLPSERLSGSGERLARLYPIQWPLGCLRKVPWLRRHDHGDWFARVVLR